METLNHFYMEGKDLFSLEQEVSKLSLEEIDKLLECWHGTDSSIAENTMSTEPDVIFREEE